MPERARLYHHQARSMHEPKPLRPPLPLPLPPRLVCAPTPRVVSRQRATLARSLHTSHASEAAVYVCVRHAGRRLKCWNHGTAVVPIPMP
jgi:hypothetical protein